MSVSVNTVAASRNFNPLSLQKTTFCPRSLGIETQFSMIRVNMGSFLFLLKMKYFNSYLSCHSDSPSSRKLSKNYENLVYQTNTPYSKMAAILVFFCFLGNWPCWPRFQTLNSIEYLT